ncbi:hypothetical protein TEA_024441 [Camellia sinensis var. sinensis]|uniref:Protein kinase domain-containing protein n=1 Tax=Camellia sinensis var. sinensis TaxID=542762 RepID=A0A4S4D2E7_CAMSN|nr:hypothetical protein TEA_024441 [Camellia sinensis var. sinensis]
MVVPSSILAFFVLSHLQFLHSFGEDNNSFQHCPESFHCGNLGEISFSYSNISYPHCGLCTVDCKGKAPKLNFGVNDQIWYELHGKLSNDDDHILNSPPISPSSNAPPAAVHLTSGLRNSLAIITITGITKAAQATQFTINTLTLPIDLFLLMREFCKAVCLFNCQNVVSVTTTEANVLDTTAPSSNALSKNKSPDIDSSNRKRIIILHTSLQGTIFLIAPCKQALKEVVSNLGSLSSPTLNLKKPRITLILLKNWEMEVLALYTMDGWEVAVKRLYEHNCKRVRQFMNEIQILTSLRHPNLVTLYGCTSRLSQELLLVYEYIPNGTVADHLHGDRANVGSLTWPIRMNIAIETASALAYLHASDIIHRDIKTNNILLDNNFCVKVADFGLSRIFPNDVTHVSTAPQGTPGYVDPEYHQCYQLTDKNDVYSFGVVLVELISSMPSIDITRHKQDINLSVLAINRIQNSTLDELVDPTLGFKSDSSIERTITSVAEVAFRCLQLDNVGALTSAQSPSSPKRDDVVLLKKIKSLSSPDFMSNKWVSSSTTSISSG